MADDIFPLTDPKEALRNAYVILRYIPPPNPQEPADCKAVVFLRDPDIRIFSGQRSLLDGRPPDELIGVEYLGAAISLSGAGSLIILVEVGTYIEFELGFRTKQNAWVTELHRIFVKMPIMLKVPGPRILLSRWLPMWMRLAHYAAAIWAGFRKIDEVEEMLGVLMQLKQGVCPDDIDRLKKGLQEIEDTSNTLLRR